MQETFTNTVVSLSQASFGLNEALILLLFVFMASVLLVASSMGRIYIFAFIAVCSILMNIYVLKTFNFMGLVSTGGNVLYGCIFLATDLLAERYNKKEAFKGVLIGLMALSIYAFSSIIYINLEPADGMEIQGAFEVIFTPLGGIAVASISAFLVANLTDITIYDAIHRITGDKLLWLRNNVSTLFSQAIDTLIFTYLAVYFGIFPMEIFWSIVLVNYIFKLIIAIFDTPFLYLSKAKIFNPQKEGILVNK